MFFLCLHHSFWFHCLAICKLSPLFYILQLVFHHLVFYNSFAWLCKLFVLLSALQHTSITLHSTIPLNYFAICLHPLALCIIFLHHLTMWIFSIALCSTISFHHIVHFLHHLVLQIPLQLFYITLFTLLHHVIHCSFFSIALYLAPTHFCEIFFLLCKFLFCCSPFLHDLFSYKSPCSSPYPPSITQQRPIIFDK